MQIIALALSSQLTKSTNSSSNKRTSPLPPQTVVTTADKASLNWQYNRPDQKPKKTRDKHKEYTALFEMLHHKWMIQSRQFKDEASSLQLVQKEGQHHSTISISHLPHRISRGNKKA